MTQVLGSAIARSNNPTAVIREKRRLRTNMAKLGSELGDFRIARSSLFDRNFAIAEAERYFQITHDGPLLRHGP
ncbi:hypothetical protein QUB63_04865 [Microcoleus sp. ARI1-B5]|uniref:hypothetical protein n=1 Tax=unclassified Microcoleus TaxID=2642155 RepID=UPI002FCF30B0